MKKQSILILKKLNRWRTYISVGLIFLIHTVHAQIEIDVSSFTAELPNYRLATGATGVAYPVVDFDIVGQTGAEDLGWSVNGASIAGITINATNGQLTMPVVGAASTVVFNVAVINNANPAENDQETFIVTFRKPIDIMVVLDGSGSMAWGYDGNFTPPANLRRWDGLLTGVGVMATQLNGSDLLGEDNLGLRLFSTGAIVPPAPFNSNLVDLETNVMTLSTVLTPNPPDGSTALGDGILAGRNVLGTGAATSKKVIIVFSDGVQNTGDQVKTVAPNAYIHTNSGQSLSNSGEIEIHTICLGSSGHNPALMSAIASNNEGHYLNTLAGAEADFATFFTTHMNDILTGSSPQFIDIRKDTFEFSSTPVPGPSGGGSYPKTEQSFSVNKGVNSLVVTLLAPNQSEPIFTSISKNGTDFIQYAQQTSGHGFISLTLKLPIKGMPAGTTLDGDWTVKAQLSSREAIPYTLMIVVDDHGLTPGFALDKSDFKVGDVLNASASLLRSNKSIETATVQAFVAKPGDDVNHLVALAQVDFNVPAADPGSPDVAKLAVLMEDPAFLEKIKAREQLVNLTYNGADSTYKGTFNGLDVTGVYQVIYRITAEDANLGKVHRYHQRSFYVRFADVDLENSKVSVTTNAQGNTVINITPVSKAGKLIGVGWGKVIALDADNAQIREVIDHGNGSYDIVLEGSLSGKGKLTIFDEVIYEGSLTRLNCYRADASFWQKLQCMGLSWIWIVVIIIIILIVWLIMRKKN